MTHPRIGITMGDPAGVGPEICLRLLVEESVTSRCVPIVFGDVGVLNRVAECCSLPAPQKIIRSDEPVAASRSVEVPTVINISGIDADVVQPGVVNHLTGAASYRYIESAISAAMTGAVSGVVTGPIHKEAIHAAGVSFPGHTELFAAHTKASRTCMMLTSSELTCSFVTGHVGLRDVPGLLSSERIMEVIELTDDVMSQLLGRQPKLAVCGLNPHAGEQGLFGDREEQLVIIPAVKAARDRGIQIIGPLSADTAFLPRNRCATDAYICMYHDQGLIPLKALAFDTAVNVTLGLPIVRTSVDHGTALDIAWQGQASAKSMLEAVRLAVRLSHET